MHSVEGMARQKKLKCHDGLGTSAVVVKMSFNSSLPCLHDKLYPSLRLHSPSDLGMSTCTLHSRL